MKKLDKYILYAIFYLPASLLLFYFMYEISFGEKREKLILDDDLNESFVGNVDSLYRDKRNHNVKVAVLSSGYKYQIPALWESKIQKGDSLIKEERSLILNIYRRDNNHILLYYKDIYKKSKQ